MPVHKSMVYPHFYHCMQFWFEHLKGDLEELEKVQRRETRRNISMEGRLSKLGLFSLKKRHLRLDMIYKTLTGTVKAKLFTISHNTRTRGSSLSASIKRTHCHKMLQRL